MYSQWIENALSSWKHTCTETKKTIIIYPGLSLMIEVEWWTNINSQCTYNLECSIVCGMFYLSGEGWRTLPTNRPTI